MTLNQPIPITIITGFLGTGKTTLLNHILQSQVIERFAVLMNDFGSVKIDAGLIENVPGRIVSLTNGCVCCSIRKELRTAILGMVNLDEPPEQILIETSGIANPLAVKQALDKPELHGNIRVDSIITVVNAEQVMSLTGEIAQLIKAQILAAEILLLSKTDLIPKNQLAAVHDWMVGLNPSASVLDVIRGCVPLDTLLSIKAQDRQQDAPTVELVSSPQMYEVGVNADQEEVLEHHELVFDVWTYTSTVPLRVTSIQALMNQLPEDIYRVKGFLHLAECPKIKTVLQKIGHRMTLSGGETWNGPPQTWLVFIGIKGSLNETVLKEEMDACQVAW
jgi:G3E family GTPase